MAAYFQVSVVLTLQQNGWDGLTYFTVLKFANVNQIYYL